jgi:hypothetical protein
MSFRPATGLTALAVACMLTQSASGQSYPPQQKADRSIEVTVQYNVRLPLKSREVEQQREVMEEGRKLLYQLAAGECTLLIAAVGTGCELARINVNTQQPRQRTGDDSMTITGNAHFRVTPKQ